MTEMEIRMEAPRRYGDGHQACGDGEARERAERRKPEDARLVADRAEHERDDERHDDEPACAARAGRGLRHGETVNEANTQPRREERDERCAGGGHARGQHALPEALQLVRTTLPALEAGLERSEVVQLVAVRGAHASTGSENFDLCPMSSSEK